MTAAQPGKTMLAFSSTARHLSGSLLLAIALPALASAQYTRISVAAGGGQPNGRHGGGVINAGGTHVAFASEA